MNPPTTPKPGVKTTEFWATLISQVIAVLVLLGTVTPDAAKSIERALIDMAGAVITIFVSGGILRSYIRDRFNLKLDAQGYEPLPSDQVPEREKTP